MTTLETKSLVPGDLVVYGQLEGRVTCVDKCFVTIDWQVGGDTSIYKRTNMGAIQRAPRQWTESDRIARIVGLEKEPRNPIPFTRDPSFEDLS